MMQLNERRLLPPVEALKQMFVLADSHVEMINVTSSNISNTNNIDNAQVSSEKVYDDGLLKRQGFRVGQFNLMVSYADGSEISELPAVSSIPNAPDWFLGFCNLHGHLIPVFDLKLYLRIDGKSVDTPVGLDAKKQGIHPLVNNVQFSKQRKMLFVIGHNENATGMIIEDFLERLEVVKAEAQADNLLAPTELRASVRDSYLIDDTLWFDLDVEKFLSDIEKSVMSI